MGLATGRNRRGSDADAMGDRPNFRHRDFVVEVAAANTVAPR